MSTKNRIIYKVKFGSHLYGTNVATSDLDYKAVFIPDAKDLVLQRAARTINNSTNPGAEKNTAEDIDMEMFSFSEYLKLLCEGQTVALDMLFVPEDMVLETSPEWEDIYNNRHLFLHKGVSSYVGYCKTQAAKYGIKGSRMAALKTAINFLKPFNIDVRLNEIWDEVIDLCKENEHMDIVQTRPKRSDLKHLVLDNWEVSNRKMTQTVRVQYALEVFESIYDRYGERARQAEKNEGIDWKALMHAVRVCYEAEELLSTGKITFPRPEKDLLLDIRNGKMDYKDVSKLIEDGLVRVEATQEISTLPDGPNREFAEQLVIWVHENELMTRFLNDYNNESKTVRSGGPRRSKA